MKFCKDCIHSMLSYRSGFTQYECVNEKNILGVSLVDGQPNTLYDPDELRTTAYLPAVTGGEGCKPDANWYEEKAKPIGYAALGYIPMGGNPAIMTGETMEERMDRLRAKVGLKSKSLKNLTLDDIL